MSSNHTSNVLKNINDCYNFADESTDPKAKTKRRTRLASNSSKSKEMAKTSAKDTEKRDHKWRCDLFKSILSGAVWMRDVRADSRPDIDSVLEMLFNHLNSKCKCVNICSTYLLIGNTYFERYLLYQKEFEAKVTAEEEKVTEPKSTEGSNNDKESAINDIPVNKESKLEANIFPDLVNEKNVSSLLTPLEKAVDNWSQALDLSLDLGLLCEETVIGFKIYYNLSSVIQIYTFYNRIEKKLKAAEILNKFCRYYGSKYSEISLTSNYYLVKTYLELGAVTKANKCLTRFPTTSSQKEQPMPETFGKSLNLLAKCEIDLMNGKIRKSSMKLKSFLDSEYLKKLTINRYYVKGLCLLIATKFAANEFDFSHCFREFLEPIQMSLSILKRWHSWLSTSKGNNENQMISSGDLDPIWYKYGVLNFAYDAMQLSALFYGQIEMPIDSVYFFNALLKLGRRYCATYRIARLLSVGSELDVICDHKHSAQIKLENASLCLHSDLWSSGSVSVFTESTDSSASDMSQRTYLRAPIGRCDSSKLSRQKSDSDLEIIEVIDKTCHNFESRECQHMEETSVWQTKRRLRRTTYEMDSDDSIQEIGRHQSLLSLKTVNQNKDNIDAFLAKIELNFYKILLNENDRKYLLNQINDILKNSIDSFAQILKTRIEGILREEVSEEVIQNYCFYKTLKLKLFESITKLQVEAREFEDAINTCHQMIPSRASNYEQRVIESNLLYLEAYSRLELYKIKHNVNDRKLWIEYDMKLINDLSDNAPEIQSTTPTRPITQSKMAPKAPKAKHYKNSEVEDYVKALENKAYEEFVHQKEMESEGQVCEKSRLRYKTSKLVFDNDSQLRSIPVNESNTMPNEMPISGDAMPSKSNDTVRPKRVTRSQTNLKSIDDQLIENVTKAERRSNRSTKKSSRIVSSSKPIDVCLKENQDLEELDDVFEKVLKINDEIKPKEKFSKESEYSLESIIELLVKSFGLIASHPSSKLYTSVHKLLAQIFSMFENPNEELIAYHYSESIRSTYRYRFLFITERKKRLNKSSKYDSKPFVFDLSDIKADNSYQTLTKSLPNDWRVIQITTVNTNNKIPDLMICRYQSGKRPAFLRIRIDPEKVIKHFMTHFNEIIERSNASIINKDRETFWRLRYSLDEELMLLLRSVDETWFGPFRGILFGQLECAPYQEMCDRLKSYVLELAKKEDLICLSEPLLEVMIESLPALKYTEYRNAMKTLFNIPSDHLITKFYSKYEILLTDVYPIDNKESVFTAYPLSPVGLILDKSLESFPFESLPSLHAYNQPIFRTPSLRMLSLMYNTYKDGLINDGVKDTEVYYVVNPADNLAKTEDYFRETFQGMTQWEGVVGKAPQPQDLKKAFLSKDAYIFFGHGAGASYYRTIPEGLDGCSLNCASLVIGCSSGKLFSDGKQLESYGTSYRFLMNGCPSYVGVLWDVTDKDIDKFSDQMMSYWFANWKPEMNDSKQVMPNTKAVSKARNVCRLKYLIGSAPVVYGLPLFTKSIQMSSHL